LGEKIVINQCPLVLQFGRHHFVQTIQLGNKQLKFIHNIPPFYVFIPCMEEKTFQPVKTRQR